MRLEHGTGGSRALLCRDRRWLSIAALLCGVAACPAGGPDGRDDRAHEAKPAAPGERTYDRYCVGCHGADGRGNGGVTGADFTGPQSPLLTRSDEQLHASVRDGKQGSRAIMPAHKPVLSDADIDAAIVFIRQRYQSTVGARPSAAPGTHPAGSR